MGDHTIFVFFYGGFVVAFVFLLLAAFIRRSHGARVVCFILACCGLVYEGGCFAVANGVGKATGGGDDHELQTIYGYISLAFLILIVWFILLVVFLPVKKDFDSRDRDDVSREDL